MVQLDKQSWPWRLLALFVFLLAAQASFTKWQADPSNGTIVGIMGYGLVVLGVSGFAFGWRIGPRVMWRILTGIFCALCTGFFIQRLVGEAMYMSSRSLPEVALGLGAFTAGSVIILCTCIALLRHAEMLPN